MSNDLNHCQFIGRLGKDPEVRYMANGDAVANLTLAVGWKSKDKEGTEWVKCTAYGKLAEICGQYLKKGSQAYVSGKFKTRKWTDKEGKDNYSTEINLEQMQMLGGKPEESGQTNRASKQDQKTGTGFDAMDNDIPF
jgi:single-strand DNA-binding protein